MLFIFSFLNYMFLVFYSISMMSLVLILLFMECLSWMFSLFLSKNSVIKYLMIQSVFFFLSILGLLWSSQLLFVAMLVKMGIPPFHLWFMNLSQFLVKNVFLFFSTIHKMTPIFFLIKMLMKNSFFIMLFFLLSSTLMMMEMSSLFYLMIFSSLTHSGWMLVVSLLSVSLLMFYWFVYSALMVLFFNALFNSNLLEADENQTSVLSFMWLIICGLPPFTIFWLKVNIFYLLVSKLLMISLLLILSAVFSLVVYYRIFHLSLFPSLPLGNMNVMMMLTMSLAWV